jgi:hypothetical protein
MSDRFSLEGSYAVVPLSPPASADFDVIAAIDETIILNDKSANSYDLALDAPFVVPFGGVTNAHVLILKLISGLKFKALITTSDGASQTVPVDSLLIMIAQGAPVTALSLVRTVATLTSVRVFLGQKA